MNNIIIKENEAVNEAVKSEVAELLKKYTKEQLALADWLYVYAMNVDDDKTKAMPACKDLVEACYRVQEKYDPYDDYFVDEIFRTELGITETCQKLGLTDELGKSLFRNHVLKRNAMTSCRTIRACKTK